MARNKPKVLVGLKNFRIYQQEEDIVEWFNNQDNYTEKIKQLIRQDILFQKINKKENTYNDEHSNAEG